MSWNFGESDLDVLELLRVSGPRTISELAESFQVTDTAIRQRLSRLVADGAVDWESVREGRGRPRHVYKLTRKGMLQVGSNFTDLALALWRGVQGIQDAGVKQQVLRGVARELARLYQGEISGGSTLERMRSLILLLEGRRIPFEMWQNGSSSVGGGSPRRSAAKGGGEGARADVPTAAGVADKPSGPRGSPTLVARACPYPELAESDRDVCQVELAYLSELLGSDMLLTECRLDGGACCRFEPADP
ncbi:MAG: HTH domain-containing protein [Thermogutta sp.]|nr:HTH domain-containing protein [Thermogutta sp.]